MTFATWNSFKIYLGRYTEHMDRGCVFIRGALQETIRPQNWFFIRYTDGGGVHLRVRWRSPEPGSQQEQALFQSLTEDMFCELVMAPPSSYRPLVSFGEMRGFGGAPTDESTQAFAFSDSYQPEYEVYLGEEHIETAHALFEASSEIAVDILKIEMDGGPSRKSIVGSLFNSVLQEFLPDHDTRQDFLKGYCGYWTSQRGMNMEYMVEDFEEKAMRLIDDGYQLFDVPTAFVDIQSRWEATLRSANDGYGDAVPDLRAFPDNLAFRFVHLMNNRLGIGLLDEAYLATVMHAYSSRALL